MRWQFLPWLQSFLTLSYHNTIRLLAEDTQASTLPLVDRQASLSLSGSAQQTLLPGSCLAEDARVRDRRPRIPMFPAEPPRSTVCLQSKQEAGGGRYSATTATTSPASRTAAATLMYILLPVSIRVPRVPIQSSQPS